MNMDELKRQAAARALEAVRDGMKLGLGTGSTAKHFVELLGERVKGGLKVIGVLSKAHCDQATPAHPSGKKLIDVVDVALDNGAPVGDSLLSLEGCTSVFQMLLKFLVFVRLETSGYCIC